MPVELIARKSRRSLPVHVVSGTEDTPEQARAWARANGFAGENGKTLILPGEKGTLAGALFGLDPAQGNLGLGALAKALPEGEWHFAEPPADPDLAALSMVLGSYGFTSYGRKPGKALRLALPAGADGDRVKRLADGVFLARDLINTPTNDMGPDDLEKAVRALARALFSQCGATMSAVFSAAELGKLSKNATTRGYAVLAPAMYQRLVERGVDKATARKFARVISGLEK